MTTKLFVYGTLMAGEKVTHQLPGYMMFAVQGDKFNFPVIQPVPDEWDADVVVYGCILEVDDQQLQQLDYYEGVARGMYSREKVTVYNLETSSVESVQVYVGGPVLVNKPIPYGVWK